MTRALIVDDHVLFAEAIGAALEDQSITVVDIATSGDEAVEKAREHRPDIVLMDLGLPDQSGLVVGQRIMEELPETTLLALTALEDSRAVKEALRTGFRGYLTKDTTVWQLVRAVATALDNQVVMPHRLAPGATGVVSEAEGQAALLLEQLTPREREVLEHLVEGESGRRIAERLGISPNTARTHIQSILTKLQVHSRLEAATFAVRQGLTGPGRDGLRI